MLMSESFDQFEAAKQSSNGTSEQLSQIFKGLCFSLIIFAALFGNALVFIAVQRFERLRRVKTNIFLVSLAMADFLVALVVMPFSACMSLMHGRWIFGDWFCDVFNANDVLFSTASILHLCCISMERYIAIINPLSYDRKMTKSRVTLMITTTWILSILISYLPIMSGIYTTAEYLVQRGSQHEVCEFVVNPIYAVVSSSTSFTIPSIVMVAVYVRIYIEARKQERKIHHLHLSKKLKTSSDATMYTTEQPRGSVEKETTVPENLTNLLMTASETNHQPITNRMSPPSIPNQSLESREHLKIHRENKAAKTLGIIIGAFILCWCPFFFWYISTNVCRAFADCPYPSILGEVLFWIGYFNSTLNPIIYAFYNRSFRRSFKHILQCHVTVKRAAQAKIDRNQSPSLRRSAQACYMTNMRLMNRSDSTE
ncbi:Octopamine receptor beta-2R [Clonorchis sinensis]|uniref:Octopamine receptor beta-1R n=2 Tax=Clonorchis sinensis TaxID=79923 RepID=H2KTF2_CLOSI|nr:Octopamine receptor beta-2R [Clonorchis sinensis]GAA38219.1 octopamine receptor beta-1R [Clonorchis sinensis]